MDKDAFHGQICENDSPEQQETDGRPAGGVQRKATLSDVARAAGVSLGTASKALRNQTRISAATRERVRAAARELSYTPNALAQSLVSGRSHTIGMITEDLQGRFSTPLLIGAERRLGEEQTSILLSNAHGNPVLERNHIRDLLSHNIEGLIVANPETNPREPLGIDIPVPLVYAYAPSIDSNDCSVTCDNVGAGKMAVRHLVDQGRSRIAVIGGTKSYKAATDRTRGVLEELDACGLELAGVLRYGDWTEAWGRDATRLLLADGTEFDAIICQNDQIARGCIDILKHRGINIPDDVAVMGHDDWDVLVTDSRPPLTSISNEVEAIGALAASMLVDAINGKPHQGITYVPCKLHARASTGVREGGARVLGSGAE